MLRLALRNLRSRKLRFALTSIAIVLGTAMISGTYVLTDQITGAFDDIFARANGGIDVIVTRKQEFTSQQNALPGPLDASLVGAIAKVPGVELAEGSVTSDGAPVVDGKYVGPTNGPPAILISVPNERFQGSRLSEGRFPSASGEIAIDLGLSKRENLGVGRAVGLQTRAGVKPVTIVGTFKFGETDAIGGATITAVTLGDAQAWSGRSDQVTSVFVAIAPGSSADAAKQRIQGVVPAGTLVETGDESANRQADTVGDSLGFLKNILFVFAAIAVLVGAYIIFNVFSITVAQRVRELAMLRTIGASRAQLRRSVILESLVVGVIASIIGLVVGILFAIALKWMFNRAGFGLPTAPISIKARTALIPFSIGVGVTLLSAIIPALRATKVPPVAVLREGATLPRPRFSWAIPYVGIAVVLLGLLAVAGGFQSDAAIRAKLSLIGFGAFLILMGVGLALRLLIRPLARLVGTPLRWVFGNSAALGRLNTTRDPARTASTATSLMIGIGLVVFLTVFIDGFKSSLFDALDRTLRSELITINDGFRPLPAGVVATANGVDGIATSLGVGFVETEVNGARAPLNGIDPIAAKQVVNFDWERGGNDALLDQLGTDGALVERGFAEEHGLEPGDRFTATTIDGTKAGYRVVGEYRDPQLLTGFTVSRAAQRLVATSDDVIVLLTRLRPDASIGDVQTRLRGALLRDYPTANVRTLEEHKTFVNSLFRPILMIFYALLAMSVFISIVGVVITLLLAVFERTREIGMMRAVGSTRGQIRAMITHESVITCAIGGITGLLVGLFLGWAIITGLKSEGLRFSVPVGALVIVFVLAVLAGILASILPARRAAKLQPLEALHYE